MAVNNLLVVGMNCFIIRVLEYDKAFQAKQRTLNRISVNSNMLPHIIDR